MLCFLLCQGIWSSVSQLTEKNPLKYEEHISYQAQKTQKS